MSTLVLALIAALGGIAVTLQAQFMGLMDKSSGTLESVFITYGGGGLVISLILLLNKGGSLAARAAGAAGPAIPWYAYTAGLLGLVIVGTIGYSAPRLGLVATFTIQVAVQFIAAALLDHFGLLGALARPLDTGRLLGMGVVLLGVWLIIR